MPLVKAPIDTRIATTRGHVFLLKASKPTYIPDECLQDAFLRGCVPVESAAPAPVEPSDELTLEDAVRVIVEEGDPEKLRGDGAPKTAAIRALGVQATAPEIQATFTRIAHEYLAPAAEA